MRSIKLVESIQIFDGILRTVRYFHRWDQYIQLSILFSQHSLKALFHYAVHLCWNKHTLHSAHDDDDVVFEQNSICTFIKIEHNQNQLFITTRKPGKHGLCLTEKESTHSFFTSVNYDVFNEIPYACMFIKTEHNQNLKMAIHQFTLRAFISTILEMAKGHKVRKRSF